MDVLTRNPGRAAGTQGGSPSCPEWDTVRDTDGRQFHWVHTDTDDIRHDMVHNCNVADQMDTTGVIDVASRRFPVARIPFRARSPNRGRCCIRR